MVVIITDQGYIGDVDILQKAARYLKLHQFSLLSRDGVSCKVPSKTLTILFKFFSCLRSRSKISICLFIWSSHILLFRQKKNAIMGQVNWVKINYFNDFINIISTLSGKKNFDRKQSKEHGFHKTLYDCVGSPPISSLHICGSREALQNITCWT